jgi:dTDP-4-dehydrorhamnose reductase
MKENLQIWGGLECTVNRIGDSFRDQLESCGHRARPDDLDRFAALGVKALRYPILWEHHSEHAADWSWITQQVERLRKLKIHPIAGLVHHGSGPAHTSLLDSSFASGLAVHALNVAKRFPWISLYTPVNEPLTTARFSCLYGHWYPHRRDAESFIRALINQCLATREAMRAIRTINPQAQLVQTEDMGRTLSTCALAYQADFENLRRWLSLDLLCGRLNLEHPLWSYLIARGASETDLRSFLDDPCPPDIIGINHYVTSERFLDERLERYPVDTHGGNEGDAYADVAAVRACSVGLAGPYGVLKETWQRYHLPLAVTEAHLGCTREEQLRWLMEVWGSAKQLRAEGADIRAVTVWSLLGAYDWNSLLTRVEGYYEPGVFDARSPTPRPTIIARCVRQLAEHGHFEHPVLANRGWWRRRTRFAFPPTVPAGGVDTRLGRFQLNYLSAKRPVLITGASGTLGRAFERIARERGLAYHLLNRREMDIANPHSVDAALDHYLPWAVINAAGYVRVDDAESDSAFCFRDNAHGPATLAAACSRRGLNLLTFSSDLVFDGNRADVYLESDTPAPLNVYGASKAEAERLVTEAMPTALIVRTSAFFGPWDEYNFATQTLRKLRAGEKIHAPSDAIVSPTYVPDLVNSALDLLIDGESGIWHLANTGCISWFALAQHLASAIGAPEELVSPRPLETFGFPARRPRFSALGSERGALMPDLQDGLKRFFAATSFAAK